MSLFFVALGATLHLFSGHIGLSAAGYARDSHERMRDESLQQTVAMCHNEARRAEDLLRTLELSKRSREVPSASVSWLGEIL